jgi:hypothetical protein
MSKRKCIVCSIARGGERVFPLVISHFVLGSLDISKHLDDITNMALNTQWGCLKRHQLYLQTKFSQTFTQPKVIMLI